jgi:alkanesulfonate monooxygenase SsuD/methylene tetrahydromethanopterin reductase-like flavin-dependent oxidoreductase (luciferase family)
MEFGISFPSYIRAWEDVRRAEEYGFSNAWFDDSHLCYSEVFATMALAADRTRRIKLGTFVLIAGNRIAPITANAMATLNEIAPGRIILGVGAGFTGRNVMGMGPRSRREIREDIAIIRDLLAGREATYREGEEQRAIKFLHPEMGFINIRDRIPIYLAANAPRMQQLVGEIGDGWIYAGCDLDGVREGFARIKQAADGSGRPGGVKTAVALASTCVLRPGEALTSARVLSRVGPHSAVALHPYWQPGEIPLSRFGPPALKPLVEKYHRDYLMKMKTPLEKRFQEIHWGHLIFLKPGEEQYMTEDLIKQMSLTGSAAEIIERIKALEQAGITQFVVRVNGTDGRELISEFGREVIAKYA